MFLASHDAERKLRAGNPRWLGTLVALAVALAAVFLASSSHRQRHRLPLSPPQPVGSFPAQPPFVLRSDNVLLPDGTVVAADIFIHKNGTIAHVHRRKRLLTAVDTHDTPNAFQIVDVSPYLVMPGLIDPHVHVNSPGRTAWEGYETATRAAAAGGTTTILDMPLNNVPSTVSMDALAQKAAALAAAAPSVDVGFIGGVVPGNIPELEPMFRAGVLAFKSFMVDSQSADFQHVTPANLSDAMHALAAIAKRTNTSMFPPYILHAELPPETYDPSVPYSGDPESYAAYLASRPDSWEVDAVRQAMDLAEESGCRIHFAHISSAKAADLVARRKKAHLKLARAVSTETCPHYLLWSAEDIPDGRTEYKCAPPIRAEDNRRALWSRTKRNDGIDLVASDHSPADPLLKWTNGNIQTAWGGIAGLQYRLQATWTAIRSLDGHASFSLLNQLLSAGPARAFGLDQVKGSIAPGCDADFVVWDPYAHQIIEEEHCMHRHTFSPFVGLNMTGAVQWSLLRGRVVYAGQLAQGSGPEFVAQQRGTGRVLIASGEGSLRSIIARKPREYAKSLAASVESM